MPDDRFYTTRAPLDAAAIAKLTDGELRRVAPSFPVMRVGALADSDLAGAMVFISDKKRLNKAERGGFSLCALPAHLAELAPDLPALVVADPKRAFAIVANELHASIEATPCERLISPDARVSDKAQVHAGAVVCEGAEIGDHAVIGATAYIGQGVVVGPHTRIDSGASVTHAIIGEHVHILAGACIGQAGFGFVPTDSGLMRVPQLGRVLIGDHAEIGANTTIDRGAVRDTIIGEGTKIDNQVQIGHNVQIGRFCVLASQIGISGSCVIEDGVQIGGQVGSTEHVTIGAGAQIAAGSGLMRDIPPGAKYGGAPAMPIRVWFRQIAALTKLGEEHSGKKKSD